jgi:hypothetical protein
MAACRPEPRRSLKFHACDFENKAAALPGSRICVLANQKTQADHNAATGRHFTP